MVIGLAGLATMAIPAFGHHGHAHPGGGHGTAHGLGGGHAPAAGPHASVRSIAHDAGHEMVPADVSTRASVLRRIPSPRAVFSVLALYGAFGNLLVQAAHLPAAAAALVAAIPA